MVKIMEKLKKAGYAAWSKFLLVFGELKLVKWFPWIQYDPVDWKIDGVRYRRIKSVLKPGDIIMRRFDQYVDNWFIRGRYSHAGIYEGSNYVIHAASPNVARIDLYDFCKCDHIVVLRPRDCQQNALQSARAFLGTPYDFGYESGTERLYCFELCAKCYLDLDVKKFDTNWLLIKRKGVYYGDSFLESEDFKVVFET